MSPSPSTTTTKINTKPVALVIGASRGIGRQVAIDLASNGYIVVVAAKSTSDASKTTPFPPDPNSSQSTINTVEREIREAGGEATAIRVDTTDPAIIDELVRQTIAASLPPPHPLPQEITYPPKKYNHLDALIYNSGAIYWASVQDTPLKRFQLMQRVNVEGLYATIQSIFPIMKSQPPGGRIIVVSPPIYSRFFRGKTAYAMGKVSMSVLTKGLAMDFQRQGVDDNLAITSIWPAVAIESAATQRFTRKDPSMAADLRKATIFSDCILAMLAAPAKTVNGQLELDEDFLRRHAGVTDFSKYSVVPGSSPRRIMPVELPDLTVKEQNDEGMRVDSANTRGKL